MNSYWRKKITVLIKTIRAGLAMVIPVLFIGSITVLLNSLPLLRYQVFLDTFLGGALRNVLVMIQRSTVGILAVYVTLALGVSYMKQVYEDRKLVLVFGNLLGCSSGFLILVGILQGEPDISLLSGQGVFSAMLAGILGSFLFAKFEKRMRTQKMVFVDGADSEFNASLHVILPFLCVTLCFAVANYVITLCFGVPSVQHLFMKVMDLIFMKMHRSYFSGFLFTTLTSIMWWFGIHGNNVLNQVSEDMFTTIIPGEIVSKSFIDTFVNMGGTGCLIGLLVALVIFGKRSSTKKLWKMALVPGVFNIGEMCVFGLPIIYNPMMIIPFLLAPMLSFSNAYLMTSIGFMPPVTTEVVWTIPALLSGYIATGSVRGLLVQLMNILISTACYAPFMIAYEKRSGSEYSAEMKALVDILKDAQENGEEVILTELEGNVGRLAKLFAVDLEAALIASAKNNAVDKAENPLLIKYQPQFDQNGRCIGAEALLRWEHRLYGTVYPPLVIEIAKESGELYKLETFILDRAIRDSEAFRKTYGDAFKLSVNATVTTLFDERYVPFLQMMADHYKLKTGNICIEITEETELVTTRETGELISSIRQFGYTFALDDFSMGHTSLQYLQHNQFDIVKLDGNLVKSILDNERTREIVGSIVYLSKSLGFKVLAEFVETKEQKKALEDIGCLLYQGYLYSPAIDKESLLKIENKFEGEYA
jgi:lactose/cellobiose-specific phosphotransferase system IIC component